MVAPPSMAAESRVLDAFIRQGAAVEGGATRDEEGLHPLADAD